MYYLDALLTLCFKYPPEKNVLIRMGTSLAIRNQMWLYERLIDSYDHMALKYRMEDCISVEFVGKGYGSGSLNAYRKIELQNKTFFEKIYFPEKFKDQHFFETHIQGLLKKNGIKSAKLNEVHYGSKTVTAYYEFLKLDNIDSNNYFSVASSLALKIANISIPLEITSSMPQERDINILGPIQTLINRISLQCNQEISDIEQLLTKVDKYIRNNVARCLGHGDLSLDNIFEDNKIIDWDNYGYYPIGFDLGLIIGLATEMKLSLDDYIEIENSLYEDLSEIITKNIFQISLTYFTILFMHSKRVQLKYKKKDTNHLLTLKLAALLKNRFRKLDD